MPYVEKRPLRGNVAPCFFDFLTILGDTGVLLVVTS